MIPMNYFYAKYHGVFITDVPKKYRKFIVSRALVGFFGVGGLWFSLEFLPISITTTIVALGTMFTTLFAFIFLNESINRVDIFAFVVCFAGVLIINAPAFQYENSSSSQESS